MRNSAMIIFVIALILISNISSYYVLASLSKDDGHNIELKKNKFLNKQTGEDSIYISRSTMVLSDGVGGCVFTSKEISQMFVYLTALSVNESTESTDNTSKKLMSDKIALNMIKYLLKYRNITMKAYLDFVYQVNIGYKKKNTRNKEFDGIYKLIEMIRKDNEKYMTLKRRFQLLNEHQNILSKKLLSGAGTLVGAHLIDQNSENPKLRVFQAGDSLFVKLRQIKGGTQDEIIYMPEFITDDMQKNFNEPSQISDSIITSILDNTDDKNAYDKYNHLTIKLLYETMKILLNKQIKEFEVDVSEKDILLVGSDGLFDNIPGPLLVVFVNYILALLEAAEENQTLPVNPETLLHGLVDEFISMMNGQIKSLYEDAIKKQVERSQFESLVSSKLYDTPVSYLLTTHAINNVKMLNPDKFGPISTDRLKELEDKYPYIQADTVTEIANKDLKKSNNLFINPLSNNESIMAKYLNNKNANMTSQLIVKIIYLREKYISMINTDSAERENEVKFIKEELFNNIVDIEQPFIIEEPVHKQTFEVEMDNIDGLNGTYNIKDVIMLQSTNTFDSVESENILGNLEVINTSGDIVHEITKINDPLLEKVNITGETGQQVHDNLIKIDGPNQNIIGDPKIIDHITKINESGLSEQYKIITDNNYANTVQKYNPISLSDISDISKAEINNIDDITIKEITDNHIMKQLKTPQFTINHIGVNSTDEKDLSQSSNRPLDNSFDIFYDFPTEEDIPNEPKESILRNFKLSACDIKEYVDGGHSTLIKNINAIKIGQCIYELIKRLKIKNNLLSKYGYKFLSAALADAAKRIALFDKPHYSPFSAKGLLFGNTYFKSKDDDISVITTGIKKTSYDINTLTEEKENLTEKLKTITNTLRTKAIEFMTNLTGSKDEFKPTIAKLIYRNI